MKFSHLSKPFCFIFLFAICIYGFNYFYKPQIVKHVEKTHDAQLDAKLIIDCKVLNKKESLECFGKDVLKAGYTPIAIAIENNTDRYFKFSPTDVTLKTIPAEVVAKKVHNKTFLRTMIWKIGSFFNPFLMLPGAAHSALEENANEKLDRKFLLQTAADRLIAPQEKIKNIIFVAQQDYQNEFTILLADKNSRDNVACKINLENNSPTIYHV